MGLPPRCHPTSRPRSGPGPAVLSLLTLALLLPLTGTVAAGHLGPVSSPGLSIAITANPTQGVVPLLVYFTATVTGAPVASVTFSWDFGDGGRATEVGANGTSLAHLYDRVGDFTASVNATDGTGVWANVSIPIVVESSPLAISATGTPLSSAPLTVAFQATVTGGSGSYRSFTWSFGNGQSASGLSALETYNASGQYLATFTVVDSNGVSASKNLTLHLTAPPAAPPPTPAAWYAPLLDLLPWTVAILAVLVAMFVALRSRRGVGKGGWPSESGPSEPAPTSAETSHRAPTPEREKPGGPSVESSLSSGPTPAGDPATYGPAPPGPAATASEAGTSVVAPTPLLGSERREPSEPTAPAPSVPDSPVTPTPKPPTVPAEALRLSFRLVLHIAAQGAVGAHEVAPPELTQAGMAKALGAKQNTIATLLKRLEVAQVLTSDVRHVKGAPRRMKVYRLTTRGEELARDIRMRRASSRPSKDGDGGGGGGGGG